VIADLKFLFSFAKRTVLLPGFRADFGPKLENHDAPRAHSSVKRVRLLHCCCNDAGQRADRILTLMVCQIYQCVVRPGKLRDLDYFQVVRHGNGCERP
jgi:hypothetical protein